MRLPALMLLGLVCLLLVSCGDTRTEPAPAEAEAADEVADEVADEREREKLSFSRSNATTAIEWSEGDLGAELLRPWRSAVADVEEVSIASTSDDEEQSAMWLAPSQEGPRPLLVALHSWSSGYRQDIGIPPRSTAGGSSIPTFAGSTSGPARRAPSWPCRTSSTRSTGPPRRPTSTSGGSSSSASPGAARWR